MSTFRLKFEPMKKSHNLTRSIEINEALEILTELYYLALANDLVATIEEKILVIRSLDLIKNSLKLTSEIQSSEQFNNKDGNQIDNSEYNYNLKGNSYWVSTAEGSKVRMMKHFKDKHDDLCKEYPSANSHRVAKLLVFERKYTTARQGNKIILHPPVG